MTFIPTANACRVDMQFSLGGQQIHNILWFTRAATWTEQNRLDLLDALATWWTTSAKQYFSSQISLTQLTAVNQEAQNAPSSTVIINPAVPGTVVGDSEPTNVAVCATLRTNLRGRSYRGRMYLAGAPQTSQTSSVLMGTTLLANLITALGALKTAIEAVGAVWVIVSKFVNKAQRTSGVATPVTAISIDQYWDSQRRRLGLRGV